MELHQLRYFVAVAEAGSASRAAARSRVAQPSLSQQILKLEQALGKRLFDRLGRGMALTDAGRALLPRAKRILAEVRDAEVWAGRSDDDEAPSLRVGAIPTMAPYLLPAALARTRVALPRCEITVREGLTETLVEAIIDGEIEAALMSTPPVDDRLDAGTFGHEELLAVVPASWTAVPDGVLALADLRDQPAVLLEEVHCLGRQVESFCASRKLAPRVVCRTTQLSTILEMVGLGMGFSLVPAMAARPHPGLRFVRVKAPGPRRPLVFVTRRGRTPGKAGLALLAALAAAGRDLADQKKAPGRSEDRPGARRGLRGDQQPTSKSVTKSS